jgi:hypothetical protein
MFSTALAATLLVPGGMSATANAAPPIPRTYLIVNLICSAVAAFVGGAVTARIAFAAPLAHGVALAGLMVAMSIVSIRQAAGRQPRWYQMTLMTAMPTIAIAGAWAMGLWSRIPA